MTDDTQTAGNNEARSLFDGLATALGNVENREQASNQYLARLVPELETVRLTRNPPSPDTAEWSHDGRDWETLSPGSIFHNSSYQPHTMRTRDQPLLTMAFYLPTFGWEGGLLDGAESL